MNQSLYNDLMMANEERDTSEFCMEGSKTVSMEIGSQEYIDIRDDYEVIKYPKNNAKKLP